MKRQTFFMCLQNIASTSLYAKLQMERWNLLTNTVLETTEDYKQLCLIHQDFLRYQYPLQTVMESQEEYAPRKSSLLGLNYQQLQKMKYDDQRQNFENYPQTAPQQPKNQFNDHRNSQLSTKSIGTLSSQLSQIKIDKHNDLLLSQKIDKEVENIDPALELSNYKQEEPKVSQFFKDETESNNQSLKNEDNQSQLWYEDAEISYQVTSLSDGISMNESHDFHWEDEFEEDSTNQFLDKQFQILIENQNSIVNQEKPQEFIIDHNTPKKKRLYCNKKKIPKWASDLSVVKQKFSIQNQNPAQLFGVLSQKALEQAFQFSESKRGESSMKWRKQKEILDNQINNIDLKSKSKYLQLKQNEQNSSKKFNNYKQNFLFGQNQRKNFLNIFSYQSNLPPYI